MLPGEHLIVIGREADAIEARRAGLHLRDTLLILLPGVTTLFAYLFRQRLEGTVAENVLRYGCGGLNIDGCRVTTSAQDAEALAMCTTPGSGRMYASSPPIGTFTRSSSSGALDTTKGRWPTNLLLVHGPSCSEVGTKVVKGSGVNLPEHRQNASWSKGTFAQDAWTKTSMKRSCVGHVRPDGTETVKAWDCQPDCPVGLLDEQSGMRPGMPFQQNRNPDPSKRGWSGGWADSSPDFPGYGDSGGASRFYPQFANLPEALAWLQRLVGTPRSTHEEHFP
jgi:hypothetical protein